MNVLNKYLKKGYSLTRLSEITGFDIETLNKFRNDEIPHYVSKRNDGTGRYLPSALVMGNQIKERLENHKPEFRILINQPVTV